MPAPNGLVQRDTNRPVGQMHGRRFAQCRQRDPVTD
jgi:hypothetical protein